MSVNPRALVHSWVGFLSQWDWDWFCTFTFRDETHPEAANKAFRHLVHVMNRELYPDRVRTSRSGRVRVRLKPGQGVRWVRALEWQRRGVLHYHALLAGVQGLRRLTMMDRWSEMAGYARIQPPREASAVTCYVSKYVLKAGEIELGGPLAEHRKICQLSLDVPARL